MSSSTSFVEAMPRSSSATSTTTTTTTTTTQSTASMTSRTTTTTATTSFRSLPPPQPNRNIVRRRPRRRPPPLIVPDGASSLPARCYESAPVGPAGTAVQVRLAACETNNAAAATRRGARRRTNEDRIFAVGDNIGALYGVCDGHGGAKAAELAAIALSAAPGALHTDPVSMLRRTNSQMLRQLVGEDYVGTTVTAASVCDRLLRIIHLGDSRAVLLDGTGMVHALTRDHCPRRRDEEARISAAGGAVLSGRVNGVLAVSRALGDCALADVLSCVPDVTDRQLREDDQLLILGTDGFFDVVSDTQLITLMAEMPCHPNTLVPKDLQAAAISLTNHAVTRRSTDDISLILVDVRAFGLHQVG